MERAPTLGILGAGQLANMLTEAANRLGIDVHVYRPAASADRLAANVSSVGSFTDDEALGAFAETVDVVTVETENIPVETLRSIQRLVPVHPAPEAIEICQDRLLEKQFLASLGIPTARYLEVTTAQELAAAITKLGKPGILKTRRFGYDGKGQARLSSADQALQAWSRHGSGPSVLEELVRFDYEISVVASRNEVGQIEAYEPGINTHHEGILRKTKVWGQIDPQVAALGFDITNRILENLQYVGVLAVEFFVTGNELMVNEMAPRVHNSGHWTQEGCAIDQFEQHVRAVMGLPLGATTRHSDVEMINIIGPDASTANDIDLKIEGSRLHLYGKREMRPGRKMGHVNRVQPFDTANQGRIG